MILVPIPMALTVYIYICMEVIFFMVSERNRVDTECCGLGGGDDDEYFIDEQVFISKGRQFLYS